MRSCFPAAPGHRGDLADGPQDPGFLVHGSGADGSAGIFYAVGVPFFPQLFLGEASSKMEEPGSQRGGPLSGLEPFLLPGICAGDPHSGRSPAHWKTAGAPLTGRRFWRLFFITSTRRYSGICIS